MCSGSQKEKDMNGNCDPAKRQRCTLALDLPILLSTPSSYGKSSPLNKEPKHLELDAAKYLLLECILACIGFNGLLDKIIQKSPKPSEVT